VAAFDPLQTFEQRRDSTFIRLAMFGRGSSMRGNLHPKVNEKSPEARPGRRALRVGRHNIVETVDPLGERLHVTTELGIAALRQLGPDSGASWRIKVTKKIISQSN
jgi:hypothetical protein